MHQQDQRISSISASVASLHQLLKQISRSSTSSSESISVHIDQVSDKVWGQLKMLAPGRAAEVVAALQPAARKWREN